jgi:hypothetical protein
MVSQKYIKDFLKQAEINKGSKLTKYEIAETTRYLKKNFKSSFMKDENKNSLGLFR